MGGCGHTPEEHEAMKKPGVWETLRFIGYQPGTYDLPDYELRNVAGTECTVSRPCATPLTEEQRADAWELIRKISLRNKAMVAEARARAAAAHA